MHRKTSWPSGVWLVLLCIALVGSSAQKQPKSQHDGHSHERIHSTKKYCEPSFSNQTKCGSGFYRERTGPYRGQCVPCRCNGLSNECDEQTGNCVNCPFNTTGNRCQRCKEGYYGNPGNRTCQACPCPFTWNNFALACLDIGSGVVQCLCKRGYSGFSCERCAHGYFGNPLVHGGSCKPCKWGDSNLDVCDPLAGGCDSCTYTLLIDLEKMDDSLTWLEQQLQNISRVSGSHSNLTNLEAIIADIKILSASYSSAVRQLEPTSKQQEADVNIVRNNLSQLFHKTLQFESDLDKVLQNVNGTKLKADELLPKAESLFTATQDLIKRLSEAKPGGSITLSENDRVRMVEEAQRFMQEMSERSCAAQRGRAGSEQEEAHTLLDLIRASETAPVKIIQASDSLRKLAKLLSEAEEKFNATQALNLKSRAALQHLWMKNKLSTLLPVTEMTKDVLHNVTDIVLMLKERQQESENHAARLDGARRELSVRLNKSFQMKKKWDVVNRAEEQTEQLHRAAAECQQVFSNSLDSNELLSAEVAANQSKEAADRAIMANQDLVKRSEGLKESITDLQTEASDTQSYFDRLSYTLTTSKHHVKREKEKREALKMSISAVGSDLRALRGDDNKVLIESAKMAASVSNSTVRALTQRVRNISQEVERLPLTTVNMDNVLTNAEQALTNLETALPVLTNRLRQVETLKGKVAPSANMTESIRRIKDVVDETRTFVNRLSIAMTFNGKSHVELPPPRILEDIKPFTSVDLLLNRHQNNPPKADRRRRQRWGKQRDANLFVFYLGNKDVSGDYIGMAIRDNVLICVFKLGDVVHQVETSPITRSTNLNSPDFDRIVFHRVYQDAEVIIIRNFTSQQPVRLAPIRHLSSTVTSVLHLDPDSVVFYVGGYPDDFTPPLELRYSSFRGAMKLSYINDKPVSLFNYKHAANMKEKQPYIKIPKTEVSDYYDGTGYRMAFVKEPEKKKRRLFKFHTNSREADALLFYIGNEASFLCAFVERGFLVLQARQAGRERRAQSAEKMTLFDKAFAITIAEQFTVHYGQQSISTEHIHANYTSYYVGGLPAHLRLRHNITAPPLRGCVDHVTADAEIIEYNRTLGVADGCPHSLLGVRTATLYSALPLDSLFVWDERPVAVSLGFRTTDRDGTLVRSRSQGSSAYGLHLSLSDGYVVFNSHNYSLKSDERYSDGKWHYLSAVKTPKGLELSVDNIKAAQAPLHHFRAVDQKSQEEKFKCCISNLYIRRLEQNFIPADLSSLPQMGDMLAGQCSLYTEHSLPKKHHNNNKHVQGPTGSQCKHQQSHRGEYQLYDEHSWLSYSLPQEDLNYRPHLSVDVKTKSSKGLILHVAGRGVVPLLALYVANGKIKMSLGQNRLIQYKQNSNDGNWHRVELSVEKHTFHLLVDGVRVTDGHLPNDEGASLDLSNTVYLGSDLKSGTIKGYNIPMNSITGCIRDFRMNNVAVGEPETSYRTLPCPDGFTEMGTYFGGGHIILDNYLTVSSHFVLSFELRPRYQTGLLFLARSDNASLSVYLMENKVGVEVNIGNTAVSVSVTPRKSLCNGRFHMVTVSKQNDVFKIAVDSTSEEKAFPVTAMTHATTLKYLHIGGTRNYSQVPVSSPFVGCLRKVKINGRPVVFETESTLTDAVSLSGCPKG
ncbi:laminin subunit alpha-3 isoform X2 [Solea solea]|uniref:laminin subunit alpha-3 isoform X2 n=1 Tax=Solea solea TaxID=90069 RepID=UPI00272D340F|nr:laminin subunit alpha-3 isoform X2 [Solea solea]